MRVLIACEFSGVVREAFRRLGHDAVSCDILPTEQEGPHIQDNVLNHLDEGWDLMIAHPPCTYLTVTGNKWFLEKYRARFPDRAKQRALARDFFMKLAKADIPRIALENPIGCMSSFWRCPDQIIQPYMFGDAERKSTCLWLKNLPKLKPTKIVKPNLYTYKDGRTDGDWHVKTMKLPAQERMKARSKTFQGIADAMADQWGANTPIQTQLPLLAIVGGKETSEVC